MTQHRNTSRLAGPLLAAALIAWASAAPHARAQGLEPVGGEFLTNAYTTGSQTAGRPAVASDGSFIVVWNGQGPGGGYSSRIFARRFASDGSPVAEIEISAGTTHYGQAPRAAALRDDSFVVVWVNESIDGSGAGVAARLLDSTAQPLGASFAVNTYTTLGQYQPDVVPSEDGGFVVVWETDGVDGSLSAIATRSFDSSGSPTGLQQTVNLYTTSFQSDPAVTRLGDDRYVVVWQSFAQDGDSGTVMGRFLDAAGAPTGSEFMANSYTTGAQVNADIAALASGGFVVAWDSNRHPSGEANMLTGRVFDASAAAVGNEFSAAPLAIRGTPEPRTDDPNLVALPDGGFVTFWENEGPIDDQDDIAGRRFDSTGAPVGSAFFVNLTFAPPQTFNGQGHAAANEDGDIVVAWRSFQQDGDGFGTFGRRFELTVCAPEPRMDCATAAKAGIQIKDKADDSKDQLKWNFSGGSAVVQADVGDPTATTGYALCVYDSDGVDDALATSIRVEPGAAWQNKDPKGAKYKDKAGASDGVVGASLKTGAAGKSKAQIKGKGALIPLPVPVSAERYFAQSPRVTVQLTAATGFCWSSEFTVASKNEVDQFKSTFKE